MLPLRIPSQKQWQFCTLAKCLKDVGYDVFLHTEQCGNITGYGQPLFSKHTLQIKMQGMWKNRVKTSQMQVKKSGLFYTFTASCIWDYLQNSMYASYVLLSFKFMHFTRS